jgi:hypothetical protein
LDNLAKKQIRYEHQHTVRLHKPSGREKISSYKQTDFVKDQIAVEVQFGKYAFVGAQV